METKYYKWNDIHSLSILDRVLIVETFGSQGISGMQPGTADPLEKVLAMIPPPPAKDSDTEPEDPDADWDD